MRWDLKELKATLFPALSFPVLSALAAALCLGCANPGPPKPPSLQLPELVKDLSAERIGNRVHLRWTTPSRTTDAMDIKGSLRAELCRTTASSSITPKKATSCTPVQTFSVVPGESSAWDDLPPTLTADPVTLMTYRIQILNAAGRSAGRSTVSAYAAAGAAPPPVDSLTVTASQFGAVLRWKTAIPGDASSGSMSVDLTRTDLTSPTTPAHKASPKPSLVPVHKSKSAGPAKPETSQPVEVHLRAAEAPKPGSEWSGTVDTSAVMGETYRYVAQQTRVVHLEGHSLEIRSQPAPAATLVMHDTFPPRSPTGLATVPGQTETSNGSSANALYIDLSWEPNTETDLAGYLVYRQLARPNGDPQSPLGKLTPLPIASTAYRDVAVAPGQRYIYSITAVDASGNESAPSAKVQEVAAAQNGGSPQ